MFKHFLFALLLAASAGSSSAQTAPSATASHPKQYCRVYINLRSDGRAVEIKMTYGQESKSAPLIDSRLAEEAAKVASFDSESQAFNYLSSKGWDLVGYIYLPGTITAQFQRLLP